jgi:hypothetical protein
MKVIKNVIAKLYYKYCFIEDSNNSMYYINYYIPGYINDGPAGTYMALKLNKETSKFEPIFDVIKYEIK